MGRTILFTVEEVSRSGAREIHRGENRLEAMAAAYLNNGQFRMTEYQVDREDGFLRIIERYYSDKKHIVGAEGESSISLNQYNVLKEMIGGEE